MDSPKIPKFEPPIVPMDAVAMNKRIDEMMAQITLEGYFAGVPPRPNGIDRVLKDLNDDDSL